jgi:trimeric autotransporter adhesin
LFENISGTNNTALGKSAMLDNTSGDFNVAVGESALANNTTASNNTAVGVGALLTNSTGINNTAVGQSALYSVTVGGENTAIGKDAGTNLTTGGNNIIVGWNAQPNTATTSNEVVLGNSSITTLRCQTQTISALSDARDKKDVKELEGAEAFIKELRPVSFVWNQRDGKRLGLEDNGFIAQELLEAQEKTGYKVPNLVLDTNPDKLQAAYAALLPTMVSALQSALNKIELLEAKIQTLESK